MDETDDHKNLYDVSETQEYGEGDPQYKFGANLAIHEHVSPSKWPMLCIAGVLAVIFLVLIILLGVTAVTLTHLNTLSVCEQSNTAALTSGGGGNITWSPEIARQISQLLNMTRDTSAKVDGIVSYTNTDQSATQNASSVLSQVLSMARDTAWKVDDLRSSASDHANDTQNITDTLKQVWQTTGDSAQKLINIVGTLSNIKDTGTSTAAVIDDILVVVDRLLELQNGSSLFNSITPVSCQDIKNVLPSSPTGWYHVNARNIYCNMDNLCNSTAGWTRLAYLDMADSTVNCPSGFRLYQTQGIRACGRPSGGASCASVQFPSNGISYSQICGRVTGYQYYTSDAVNLGNGGHNNLNSWYVDGVSITRGSPRQHVWTLMAGGTERPNIGSGCPCTTGSPQVNYVQSFVGNNYFCESGNPNNFNQNRVFAADPLWDGQNCRFGETACCMAPGIPWFHRNYGNTTTTDYIELRVCSDQGTGNEDSPIGYYEIYVM